MISSTTQTTTPPNLPSTTHSISLISDIMEEISNQSQLEKHDSDNGVTLVKLNATKRFIVNCFLNSCLLYWTFHIFFNNYCQILNNVYPNVSCRIIIVTCSMCGVLVVILTLALTRKKLINPIFAKLKSRSMYFIQKNRLTCTFYELD